ncbi:hypothetical protein MNB_SV-12-1828 [hydrothermal vent metagenome]|uniref:Uncharacterized protein n=1 Tax=hydrothermal vent metagenome TaxID=652676 RepID=A0A1W1BA04_9ZZZZ
MIYKAVSVRESLFFIKEEEYFINSHKKIIAEKKVNRK